MTSEQFFVLNNASCLQQISTLDRIKLWGVFTECVVACEVVSEVCPSALDHLHRTGIHVELEVNRTQKVMYICLPKNKALVDSMFATGRKDEVLGCLQSLTPDANAFVRFMLLDEEHSLGKLFEFKVKVSPTDDELYRRLKASSDKWSSICKVAKSTYRVKWEVSRTLRSGKIVWTDSTKV